LQGFNFTISTPTTHEEKLMKKIANLSLILIAAAACLLPAATMAAAQTFDGVVSDSMCVRKHMMPGKSDAECIQECVKAGSKYVLVSGAKVYTLNAKAQTLAAFAGKHVQVQGAVKNNILDVQSIHESASK
jgi:hypothetical protein